MLPLQRKFLSIIPGCFLTTRKRKQGVSLLSHYQSSLGILWSNWNGGSDLVYFHLSANPARQDEQIYTCISSRFSSCKFIFFKPTSIQEALPMLWTSIYTNPKNMSCFLPTVVLSLSTTEVGLWFQPTNNTFIFCAALFLHESNHFMTLYRPFLDPNSALQRSAHYLKLSIEDFLNLCLLY